MHTLETLPVIVYHLIREIDKAHTLVVTLEASMAFTAVLLLVIMHGIILVTTAEHLLPTDSQLIVGLERLTLREIDYR